MYCGPVGEFVLKDGCYGIKNIPGRAIVRDRPVIGIVYEVRNVPWDYVRKRKSAAACVVLFSETNSVAKITKALSSKFQNNFSLLAASSETVT